jgi:hypothetical protein
VQGGKLLEVTSVPFQEGVFGLLGWHICYDAGSIEGKDCQNFHLIRDSKHLELEVLYEVVDL